MKKLLLCYIVCLSASSYAQRAPSVFVSGKINGLTNSTTLFDQSAVGALRPKNKDREIILAKDSSFSIRFTLSSPGYFGLGRNVLYLSPGDKLRVSINFDRPEKSTFLGDGAEEDDFLKTTPYVNAESYLAGGLNLKGSLQESIQNVLLLAEERRARLKALGNVPSDFSLMENARIDADIINSFKLLGGTFNLKNKIPKADRAKVLHEADSVTRPLVAKYSLGLANPRFLDLDGVRQNFYRISDNIAKHGGLPPQLKDWQYAYELAWYINEAREKKEIRALGVKIDSIQNTAYRKAVKELFDLRSGFFVGDLAFDIKMVSAEGKAVSLSDYKGAIIYIDLWATWCVPCLEDMPRLDSLRTRYSNNPNVVFISLSTNYEEKDWRKYLNAHHPKGIQLLAKPHALDPYNVTAIPKVIVVGRDFKILSMDGPLPSSPQISKYLEGILNP